MDPVQDHGLPSHASVCSLRHARSQTTTLPLRQHSPSVRPASSHDRLNDVVLRGPPPPALTTGDTSYDPGSPLTDLHSSPPTRGHQKSFSTTLLDGCRPLVNRATSSVRSLKEGRAQTHSPLSNSHTPDDDDGRPQTAHRDPSKANKLFGDWFNGNSGPVNLGLKQSGQHDDGYPHSDASSDIGSDSDLSDCTSADPSDPFSRMDPISTDAPSTAPTMASSIRGNTPRHSPAPSTASKISTWFSRGTNNQPSHHAAHASRASLTADPLLHLDIQHALFPHGAPDPLDPASYNDLLITSTKLIQQYQSAYRGLTTVVRDARAEQDASRDEADEADTRARHLKMQLDGMAAKAAEQDLEMRALADELAEERARRQEDEETHARSLRLAKQAAQSGNPNRRSADVNSVSDSGFESDGETALESSNSSVFSRADASENQRPQTQQSQAEALEREIEALCTPRQPSATARKTAHARAEEAQTTPKSMTSATGSWKPGHVKRPSTLDRVLGRKVSQPQQKPQPSVGYLGDVRGSQMDVWRENRDLRDRVVELERSVDESLRVLGGFGF